MFKICSICGYSTKGGSPCKSKGYCNDYINECRGNPPVLSVEQKEKIIEKCKNDPSYFIKEFIGIDIHDWRLEILNSILGLETTIIVKKKESDING